MSREVEKAALLDALEAQAEAHLQEAVGLLQNLPEKTLQLPAANGGWSIAQCLWHLNSYGDYYLPLLEAALKPQSDANNTVSSGWLGAYFIKMMQPGAGRYNAFKGHVPPDAPAAHETVATFIAQQERMLLILRRARHANLNRRCVPISIMRWLRLRTGDVLQFMIAHNERHMQQAKRNYR